VDVRKDITVEVTGRQLTVRGERRDERTSEDGGRNLREVRYGSFSRSFTLPEHVDPEVVSATYGAGVLSVRGAGAYRSTAPRLPGGGATGRPSGPPAPRPVRAAVISGGHWTTRNPPRQRPQRALQRPPQINDRPRVDTATTTCGAGSGSRQGLREDTPAGP